MRKSLSIIISLAMLLTCLPSYASAFEKQTDSIELFAATMSLDDIKSALPSGTYWNHKGTKYEDYAKDKNKYNLKSTKTPCNHSEFGETHCCQYNYSGKCGCNAFGGSTQCMAFARFVCNKLYGETPDGSGAPSGNWKKTSIDNLKQGDYIRYKRTSDHYGHSVVVVKVTDTTIKVGEANHDGKCGIDWGRSIKKSTLKGYYSVKCLTYPGKISKPSAPEIKMGTVNDATETSVKIEWKSVKDASEYRVDGKITASGDYKTLTTTNHTEYTWKGLSPGTTYYMRVYAKNSAGTSGYWGTYEIHTKPAQPNKPTAKTLSTSEINVNSWGHMAGTDRYKVCYYKLTDGKEKGTTTKYAASNSNEYTINGLAAGTEYGIYIVAQDQGKMGSKKDDTVLDRVEKNYNSKESPTKTKVTSMAQPNAQLISNNTQIKLSWNAINTTRQFYYRVYRDGIMIKDNINGLTYTDSDIQDGKKYTYYVQAVQKDNNNPRSDSVKISVTVPQKIVDLGGDFYASISTNTGNLPVKSEDGNVALGNNENTGDTLWRFQRDSDGSYKLTSGANGEVMEAYGWGNENGTNVGHAAAHDGNKGNQRWFIYEQGGGYVFLPSYNSGLALDVSGGNIVNGTNIQLWERNNGIAQVYQIHKKNSIGSSPYLNVQTGTSNSNTKLTWNAVNGAERYTVSIYKDKSFYKEENVRGLEYSEILPVGSYSAKVTASNAFATAPSNEVTFEVGCVHQYTDWTTQTQPTCENNGLKVRTCNNCGATQTEEVAAIGHNYVEQSTPANCTEDGETRSVCEHCGNIQNVTIIPAHGHTFGEWVRTSDDNGIKEVRTCTECGFAEENIIDEENHNYVLTDETQPTLDAPGTRTYTCTKCGDVYTEEWVETINAGTIKIGDAIADIGETLTVPVGIEDNPGFAGFMFDIDYDKTALTPVKIIKADLTESGTFEMNIETDEDGSEYARVVWFSNRNVVDDGELFKIQFKVKNEAAKGKYPVSVIGEIANDEMSDVMPEILTNYITVGDYMKGDVNLDKFINGEDARLLAKYIVALPKKQATMFTSRQREAANVYNPSVDKLDKNDGIRLSQIIAGYDVSALEEHIGLMDAETATVSVESINVIPGNQVYVPVYIENNPGIAGFNMHIDYDTDNLTLLSVQRDELTQGGMFNTTLDDEEDVDLSEGVNICWCDADNMSEDGILFYLVFEVNDTASIGDVLPIEIDTNNTDFSNMHLQSISTDVIQGKITVAECVEEIPVEDDNDNIMPFEIFEATMSVDNTVVEHIPADGEFNINVLFNADEEAVEAFMIVIAYDENGKLITLTKESLTFERITSGMCSLHMSSNYGTIDTIKVFIWDSLNEMQPQAKPYTISSL